jgi:hypothetical protein
VHHERLLIIGAFFILKKVTHMPEQVTTSAPSTSEAKRLVQDALKPFQVGAPEHRGSTINDEYFMFDYYVAGKNHSDIIHRLRTVGVFAYYKSTEDLVACSVKRG